MVSYRDINSKIFYRILRKQALSVYTPEAAADYRLSDVDYYNFSKGKGKLAFVHNAARFHLKPTILDMGCGTGRYFHCCDNAKSIVAFDLSHSMLLEARKPIAGANAPVALINSSLDEIEFKRLSFDLVYCMGVFGCVLPLDDSILIKVARWLKPGGAFCFDVIQGYVEPSQGTWRSRLAKKIQPYLFGPAKAYVDAKLMGFTIDRPGLDALVSERFEKVEIQEFAGRGRMDLLCMARIEGIR